MMLARCLLCDKVMSNKGIRGHIRFAHHIEDKDEIEKNIEFVEAEDKEEQKETPAIQKFDKHIRTSSDIVKSLREQYEILNYQRMIEDLRNPKPTPTQQQTQQFTIQDMMGLFNNMLQAFQNIASQQKQTSLIDELEKIKLLKELASEISSSETDTDTSMFRDIFKFLLTSELQRKPSVTPVTIPNYPIPNTKKDTVTTVTNKESESMEIDITDFLTDNAKKQIASMPEDLAYQMISKYFKISKKGFKEIYKKCQE